MESLHGRGPGRPHFIRPGGIDRRTAVQVEATEFCELAVSGRNLIRCDDGPAGVRGLIDTDTGETFLVDELKLFAFAISGN